MDDEAFSAITPMITRDLLELIKVLFTAIDHEIMGIELAKIRLEDFRRKAFAVEIMEVILAITRKDAGIFVILKLGAGQAILPTVVLERILIIPVFAPDMHAVMATGAAWAAVIRDPAPVGNEQKSDRTE